MFVTANGQICNFFTKLYNLLGYLNHGKKLTNDIKTFTHFRLLEHKHASITKDVRITLKVTLVMKTQTFIVGFTV